jgi:transposase
LVRRGFSNRATARRLGISDSTVRFWLARAAEQRPDRVDFSDRSNRGRPPANRTSSRMEKRVLAARGRLKKSGLGQHGALAIRSALLAEELGPVPALRTIGRILKRHGALDGRTRQRYAPPPRGWYLPGLADARAELDAFDFIEELVLRSAGSPVHAEVFNAISFHGRLAASWQKKGPFAVEDVAFCLEQHWRKHGLPHFAQFDNDTTFQGSHTHPDLVGRISRMCLSLGVIPVFAPPAEFGFQAQIENFNGLWRRNVWQRFTHSSLPSLRLRARAFITGHRAEQSARGHRRAPRRAFPDRFNFQRTVLRPLRGCIVYIRRTDDLGRLHLLGHRFPIDTRWPNRLVRAEVDLDEHQLRVHALRRKNPAEQPLLKTIPYRLPARAGKMVRTS